VKSQIPFLCSDLIRYPCEGNAFLAIFNALLLERACVGIILNVRVNINVAINNLIVFITSPPFTYILIFEHENKMKKYRIYKDN
jgi:hypothetical protein